MSSRKYCKAFKMRCANSCVSARSLFEANVNVTGLLLVMQIKCSRKVSAQKTTGLPSCLWYLAVFFIVKKKRSPINQEQKPSPPPPLIHANMSGSLMGAVAFLLVMFGALIVRPLFRLFYKFIKGEQQTSFQMLG